MNPCKNCTRVPSPDACDIMHAENAAACDNKQCPEWRAWWISQWEKTCLAILRLLNKQERDNGSD